MPPRGPSFGSGRVGIPGGSGPQGPGGPGGVAGQSLGSSSSTGQPQAPGSNSQLAVQQQIMQQLRMAVQARLINPALLNQQVKLNLRHRRTARVSKGIKDGRPPPPVGGHP
jgi:hypothetical protein